MLKKIRLRVNKNINVWMDQFREIYTGDKSQGKFWFWDNFDWKTQSLWIGKFNRMNHLPETDQQIKTFLQKLVEDLNHNKELKSILYIKFYFSRNISTGLPEINYLMICNNPQLPTEFSDTLTSVMFEQYPITETIVEKDQSFKELINHYLNWSNYYTYYDLIGEVQY